MEFGINLNVTAANKPMPHIERQIRVIKEHVYAIRHPLPFQAIPLSMLINLVYLTVNWINAFPSKGSISDILSPRAIMIGTQLNFKTDCQLAFETYVQVHQELSPTNTQEAHTVGTICLGPTGNIQGSYKFLNLCTSKKITHHKWTVLPMLQEMINCVN